MLKRQAIFILGALSLLLSSVTAFAESRVPVFQVIGQEPYSFRSKKGVIKGYHYLIANKILQEAGYNATAEPVPLKRLIRDMRQGLSDCALAANSPFARDNFAVIEDFNHHLEIGIMPRSGIDLKTYDDLRTISIGIPAGMSIGEPFDSDDRLLKVPTPDYHQSALMLQYKRIDAIMGALESIEYGAYKALNGKKMAFGQPLVTQSVPIALICSPVIADTPLVAKLKAATIRLKERGEIQQIIDDFFVEFR